MKNQIKVTIYEAVEKTINVEYPICFRTNEQSRENRSYYRFTDDRTYCEVLPFMNSIKRKLHGFESIESAYKNMTPIEDEIFEHELKCTMEQIKAVYTVITHEIDAQYDTEAQRDAELEARALDAINNYRNH